MALGVAPTDPDLVYLVRPGDENEELRFSLRSVARNLPHNKVWIAGHRPAWVTNVESIELDPLPDKYDNQRQSLLAACDTEEVSDPFILMNDDFFVMRPIDRVEVLHGPTVAEHHQSYIDAGKSPDAPHVRAIWSTLEELRRWGYENPLTYELHSPLPMSKSALAGMLRRSVARPFLWQTAYAVIAEHVGAKGYDAKNDVVGAGSPEAFAALSPYLSTYDGSFKNEHIGAYIRAAFPAPCAYES